MIVHNPNPTERVEGFIAEIQPFIDANSDKTLYIQRVETISFQRLKTLNELPSDDNLWRENIGIDWLSRLVFNELKSRNPNLIEIPHDEFSDADKLVCIIIYFK